MRGPRPRAWLLAALAVAACAAPDADDARPAAGTAGERPVVLVVGTSLSAGLGVDPSEAWPAVLQRRIDSAGLPHRVVNAGESGETSAGALARMNWLLRQEPAVLIVETGANDGLRGQDPAALRANLEAIVERTRERTPEAAILLLGMEAPRNWGPGYVEAFRSAYADVARAHDLAFVPFFLDGVAGVPSLNQADGIHPTAEGQRRMASAVWSALEPLLR